ncbi:NAD-dependent epimerase/dehydratase family protein [Micrococcus terreus]|uniref:NAD-dependent epimerase/dehydratase family protein n=1 Tax=Micrococcus terreus TaxID=574650 RepID=UPI00254EC9B9|nr:NAD(P)-dependent oxidoreductase [Micrococcus terreus]MDK7702454.1 NAD(P)-dependent oxidoreductase [Micrococcus terreus]WOO96337.1 NAD(P)-dependent oxidoreductase [Micrococcus terreus]
MTSAPSQSKERRIVITGGTGVLGRHLVRHLSQSSPNSSPVVLTRDREMSSDDFATVELVETDYSTEHLAEVLTSADAVVHLAASRSSSPDVAEHLPSLQLADDVFAAASSSSIPIIYASSISVYGTDSNQPWIETMTPQARMPYGVLKLAAERLGARRAEKAGTRFVALRLGHLYGAGESNGYMINVFMDQARVNSDLHLHAPSVARRDFLYAGEAARAIELGLDSLASGVFNISSGKPATNREMAEAVIAGFESRSAIVIDNPEGQEGILPTEMDIRLAGKGLKFTPRYSHLEAFREIRAITSEVS